MGANDTVREFRVPVIRVEQERSYWCGAACAKMILDSVDVPCVQEQAFKAIYSESRFVREQLFSDPEGLCSYLNLAAPTILDVPLEECPTDNANQALQTIFGALSKLKLPCITLTSRGNHWVVIDAIRVRETASGGVVVLGVYVENPWFKQVSSIYIDASELIANYLTQNQWGVTWKDKIVVITDGKNHGKELEEPSLPLLPSETLSTDAIALAAVRLHQFEHIESLLRLTGQVDSESKVHDLDKSSDYIITKLDGTGNALFQDIVYVALDALSGQLLQLARASTVPDFPDQANLAANLRAKFPQAASIEIDAGLYFQRRQEMFSRFDVARKVMVDSEVWFVCRSGEIIPEKAPIMVAGG